ncbi:MAG: ATP-binding cassette domain-containing protein, partial [Candidatus Marinimicrobia bacterium]|nr:ATP-binding cassette domain-containing protein [Candidatus Neomarinimicrobiota bacterium]
MQKPLFELKNLTCKIKTKTVLSITKFEIHRGIIYTIIGQPGAGKSTLLETLANQRKATGGTVIYDGDVTTTSESRRKYKEEVYFLPQAQRRAYGLVRKYMLKHIRTMSWSTGSADQRLETVSKLMNLADKLDRAVKTLSPGERRWIELAICLASDSKVLIIDELEQHISYDELELVKRQLQRKCNYEGTTIIMSTLNPATIHRLNGVSVTLDRGRIAMIRSVRDGGRSRRSPGGGRSSGSGSGGGSSSSSGSGSSSSSRG